MSTTSDDTQDLFQEPTADSAEEVLDESMEDFPDESIDESVVEPASRASDPRFKNLGAVVRKIRLDKGLTQGQVAEALHVTPGYISNVENGRTSMSLKILVYYAELTSTSLDSLVGIAREDYRPIALDNDIMDAISKLSLDAKQKLLKALRIWNEE